MTELVKFPTASLSNVEWEKDPWPQSWAMTKKAQNMVPWSSQYTGVQKYLDKKSFLVIFLEWINLEIKKILQAFYGKD